MQKKVPRPLVMNDVEAAGRLLADAFRDDPFFAYVFPDPTERARLAPVTFATLVRGAVLTRSALTTEPATAVLTFSKPGEVTTPEDARASGYDRLPEIIGRAAFERLGRYFDFVSNFHHPRLPADHWYIGMVAVVATERRLGQAQALMNCVLERANAVGQPVCLDTANPANYGFWLRCGFRPVVIGTDPASGFEVQTWQRDPS